MQNIEICNESGESTSHMLSYARYVENSFLR